MSSDPMVARDQLKSIVERIERLEEEKKSIAEDIRDVYAEAKANGFDTKVLRQVVTLRKKDMTQRQEEDAVRDLYLTALGMLPEFEAQGASNAEQADEMLKEQESQHEPPLMDIDPSKKPEEDFYEKARLLVINDRKASTSYIQRKLSLGYNKAAEIMERLEANGIVSAADNAGKREILEPDKQTEDA